jgi:hypothetical protein
VVATPVPPLPSGNDPSQLEAARNLGWNWGGFLLPYLWLIGHGRLSTGLLLILTTTVPFVCLLHFLIYPVTAIYLGLNGYEVSWRYRTAHSIEQLRDGEREWIIWGVVCILLILLGTLFFVVYLKAFVSQAWQEMETMGW